jgi:hypothetical protein
VTRKHKKQLIMLLNGLMPKKFTCKDDRVLSLYAQAGIGSAELPLNNRRLEARRKKPEPGTK